MLADGKSVGSCRLSDPELSMAVNSRVDLAQVDAVMRRRILERLMLSGVTVIDPATPTSIMAFRSARHGPAAQTTCAATPRWARSATSAGTLLTDVRVGNARAL